MWASLEEVVFKWTSSEQVIIELWNFFETVVKRHEQVVSKSGTNYDKLSKSWGHVMSKSRISCWKIWTSHEKSL